MKRVSIKLLLCLMLFINTIWAQEVVVKPCARGEKCNEAYLSEKHPNFRGINANLEDKTVTIWIKKIDGVDLEKEGLAIFESWLSVDGSFCEAPKEECLNPDYAVQSYQKIYKWTENNYLEWRAEIAEIEKTLKSIDKALYVVDIDFYQTLNYNLDDMVLHYRVLNGFKEAQIPKLIIMVPNSFPFDKLGQIQSSLYRHNVKVFFGTDRPIVHGSLQNN